MKRILSVSVLSMLAVGLIGLGVAWSRPDLVPSWARLPVANAHPAEAGPYCNEHGVPERFCTICHEELTGSLLLCKEHGGIPEDICTLCHPEAEEKHDLVMCSEHGLPEHFCYLCGNGPAASVAQPDDGWCATHNQPEPLCTECADGPRPIGPLVAGEPAAVCRQPLPVVRLASEKLIRQVGITTESARSERHVHRLAANAVTAYDANRYAEVSPRVDGYLREVRVDLGQPVQRGDVLAVVDSAQVSAGRTQYLSAHAAVGLAQANHERTRSLVQSNAAPAKQELEALTALNLAQAAMLDAEQTLRNLGFTDEDLARIVRERDTRNALEVTAPIDGVIVQRHAVQGEAVQATTQLFAVTDTTRMWLWIDVYEADIARVQAGQEVRFTISGAVPESLAEVPSHTGRITWVGTEVDPTTRTTRVRAELDPSDGRLRANVFGTAEIRIGDEHEVVVIPRRAVQRNDDAAVVFVPVDATRFRPQRIVARPSDRPDVVEVAWGLEAGQPVVTEGSFWLKTEIMKGSIGAGCCE